MRNCFSAADILLPAETDLSRWAVIACDQFTSQPEYWREVEKLTEQLPSAAHLIFPEAELTDQPENRVAAIHDTMLRYLHDGILREYPNSFVYTERSLKNGEVRHGLIGMVDLEQYDYTGTVDAQIRATEQTVTERIPPRMAVRRGAALELPHVLLLCDDEKRHIIEPLSEHRDGMPKLYDFDLMMNGGHIRGWLVSGEEKRDLENRIRIYEETQGEKHPGNLLYAVGDGNHSLATAKACWEELKREGKPATHPARWALCELNNIHDESQVFEPIHRIVKNCDTKQLISDATVTLDRPRGEEILWVSGAERGILRIPTENGLLPLAVLQDFLDRWLSVHGGELDYIHGDRALEMLEREEHSVGFRMPPIAKESLFPGILSGGVLPRKTFSMGEAEEKRYYLEARRITG